MQEKRYRHTLAQVVVPTLTLTLTLTRTPILTITLTLTPTLTPTLEQVVVPHAPRVSVLRLLSTEAAAHFADESLGFVYLDANHGYRALLDDLVRRLSGPG